MMQRAGIQVADGGRRAFESTLNVVLIAASRAEEKSKGC